jgi:phospholipid/cholesterol/gamma-HCH transport system permease protein
MVSLISELGAFARYSGQVLKRIARGGYTFRHLLDQMHRIGVESLTVVNLCAFFIGLVMVVQTAAMLARFGAKQQLSGIISASFVREIGPVFAAIMFTGRIGTGIAAEIGSMVVTEQVDAYRVFGADPLSRIAAPRVLATVLMLPALTVVASLIGIISGFLMAVLEQEPGRQLYMENALSALSVTDVSGCLLKGACFGLLVGLVATYLGFRTPRATEAVGISATNTMVHGVLGILVVDLILTKLLLLFGDGNG